MATRRKNSENPAEWLAKHGAELPPEELPPIRAVRTAFEQSGPSEEPDLDGRRSAEEVAAHLANLKATLAGPDCEDEDARDPLADAIERLEDVREELREVVLISDRAPDAVAATWIIAAVVDMLEMGKRRARPLQRMAGQARRHFEGDRAPAAPLADALGNLASKLFGIAWSNADRPADELAERLAREARRCWIGDPKLPDEAELIERAQNALRGPILARAKSSALRMRTRKSTGNSKRDVQVANARAVVRSVLRGFGFSADAVSNVLNDLSKIV